MRCPRITPFVRRLTVAWAACLACLAPPAAAGDDADKRRVIATTSMIADAARQVAGDRAEVTALMGPGIDPHLYKASPGDMRTLPTADLILFNGLHLEGRLADTLVKLARTRPMCQVTDAIPEGLLREPPEFDGHFDPHVWFDAELWARVAERIRDALAEIDPEGAATYNANAAAYTARLRELHAWTRAEIAAIPRERRILVTAHDAFGYFGAAYDIEVLAVQGISTDSEASVRDINNLVDTLVRRQVPAVFVESSVPRKTIEALIEGCAARGHAVRIGGELYSDALGPPGSGADDYVGMVRHNVSTIVAALAGKGEK